MNNITFRVAPKGEGKTKWLLNIAKKYVDEGHPVFLYTHNPTEYRKFCDKYFVTYAQFCPVEYLKAFSLTPEAVVLVDDLFSHDASLKDFVYIQKLCYKLFVAVNGVLATDADTAIINDRYVQMTIDTLEATNA